MDLDNNCIQFSVVIPTYNRAHLISKTIDSILHQTYTNYEILVVDDGSTDDTEELILNKYQNQVRYYKKENAERAAARNFGTQHAKGKYILWFDSDDIMYSNHLNVASQFIQNNNSPEIIALSFDFWNIEDDVVKTEIIPQEINANLYKGNLLSCDAVFVRKDIALSNPFNEDRNLSASEDYELWLRLASQFKIWSFQDVTSAIVLHDERSVATMADANKLINRFEKFLKYTTENKQLMDYFGENASYFIMKNYLILAVDLAVNKHKKEAQKYLKLAIQADKKVFLNRTFYATVKHLIV